MHRLLIAAASAAIFVTAAAPALADDYPPCKTRDQDHCKVVPMAMHHGGGGHHHHHHEHKGAMSHKGDKKN
jgi:hypothetical protein